MVGQLEPWASLFAILVPGQHLNRAVSHRSAVVVVVVLPVWVRVRVRVRVSVVGLGSGFRVRVGVVAGQLEPPASRLLILVPG